jgi:hypothetical protein
MPIMVYSIRASELNGRERAKVNGGSISAELHQLAHLLRLTPSSDPEKFYIQKNALVFELKKLAQRMTSRPVGR